MATKKKVLSDQDYEEFNKMMAEYEASHTPAKIRFAHDDGSIWYEGMRGGHGDRDFVRHRLHYPAVPFSVTLDSDALNRFLTVANDEDSTVEEVFNAYVTEARKLDPVTEPIKIEDLDNAAALAFFFADYLQRHKGRENEIVQLTTAASNMFRDVAALNPRVYDQYAVASLDLMASAYLWMEMYEEAEKGYTEALNISRQDMAKFGPVDWTARLVYQYWHMGNFYKAWGKTKKAIAYYEEGWRTFNANGESVMADAIDDIEESLCQLYEACGMTEKLQRFQTQIQEE